MLNHLVSNYPDRYEAWKASLKRFLPITDAMNIRLSGAISHLHQLFFENFVFIHINKCGGTSVERALGIPLLNHDTALQRRAKLGDKIWDRRFKFSLIRDPYHRAASLFFFRHRKQPDIPSQELPDRFVQWLGTIRDMHDRGTAGKMEKPQFHWITDDSDLLIVDHLCRLEQLNQDLELVRRMTGKAINVKQLNKKGRSVLTHDELYSCESRNIVNCLYAVDFERLDYQIIPP